MHRLVLLTALLLGVQLTTSGCFGLGSKRSVQAFCNTFKDQAIMLHDKYDDADKSIQSGTAEGTLTGLVTLVQSTGDFVVMFSALDKVAPDDIEPSVAQVLDSFKQAEANNAGALTDPLKAMGSGLIIALESGGAFNNVNTYISQHCDLSFEN